MVVGSIGGHFGVVGKAAPFGRRFRFCLWLSHFGLYDFFRKCSSPGMNLSLSSFSTCMIVHPPTASRSPPNFRGPGGEPFRGPFISFSPGTFRQSALFVPCMIEQPFRLLRSHLSKLGKVGSCSMLYVFFKCALHL